MAKTQIKFLTRDSTSTTGTTDFVLDQNPPAGYLSPAEITAGEEVGYYAFNTDRTEWEAGRGTRSGAATITRDTVRQSSAALDAKVSFSAGSKNVICGLDEQDLQELIDLYNQIETITDNEFVIGTGTGVEGHSTITAAADGSAIYGPNGSVVFGNKPGLSSQINSGSGLGFDATNVAIWVNDQIGINLTTAIGGQVRFPRDFSFGWSSDPNNNAGSDTTMSRKEAGTVAATALELTGNLSTFGDVRIVDAGADHWLSIVTVEDQTANRQLQINLNDADRSLSLSGNLTVSTAITLDQSVASGASPTFTGTNFTGLPAAAISSGTLVHERGGLEADVSAGDGFIEIKAGSTTVIKSNLAAAVAPGATDDLASGYAVGSIWIDTTADKSYFCVDATATAAVWNDLTSGGSGDVASDAIWDAKGDLAGGTGADTAAKLTIGSDNLGLKADSGESTGMKWGAPGLIHTAEDADANIDCAVNELSIVDMNSGTPFTASRIWSLPTTAAVGDRCAVYIKDGDATHELQIRTTAVSGDTIDGTDYSSADLTKLFITGEYMEFECITANTAWRTVVDGRIPCNGRMELSTDLTTNTAGTWTTIPFDSSEHDVGDVVDATTNNGIVARRKGLWVFGGGARPSASVTDADYYGFRIYNSTSGDELSTILLRQSHATASGVMGTTSNCSGDVVADGDLIVAQMVSEEANRGADQSEQASLTDSATHFEGYEVLTRKF